MLIKTLTLAIVLFATTAYAATITVTPTGLTQKETDATAWKVQQINAQRALASLPPFASFKTYIESYLANELLPQLVREHAEATATTENIKQLWESATPAQRTAAINALKGL